MKELKIEMQEERFREVVMAIGIIDDRWLKENWWFGYYSEWFVSSSEVALEFREWLDDLERTLAHESGAINLLPYFEESFGGHQADDIMLHMVYHRLNKSPDTIIEELRESIDMEANTELMKKIDADWEEIKEVTELMIMIDDLIEEKTKP